MALASAIGQYQSMPAHLLIVDASELIRVSLRRLVEGLDGIATVREAATFDEALKQVRYAVPTLAILDLYFPIGMGLNVIRELKFLAPSLLIAVLTFQADNSYRKRCLALGADWFFDKATDTDLLLQVIQQTARANSPINPNQCINP